MPDGVTEGQSAQKNTLCRFVHPSWSSLFLWQGHITIHSYDVIKLWEGYRAEINQIKVLRSKENPRRFKKT